MQETNRATRRPRGSTLRVGELTASMAVAAAIGLATGLAAVAVDEAWLRPPPIELGTVQSVRVLLGAVTGGLITVAVFSLWMRTVVVGLVADHFSPRTLVSFLEDRFQRNLLASMSAGVVAVLAILVGLPSDEEAAAPLVGTVLAVMIALAALAGVLLAIQHATRSLSLPELVSRLADNALEVLGRQPEARVELTEVPPVSDASTVRAPGTGWVTGIDIDRMREALPAGGVVHLRTRIGAYVTPRSPVALVSLAEADGEADLDAVGEALTLARTRSPDMDLAFAVGQLLDVGAFALHGSTDTATAHEVLVHLGAVLEEVIERGLPPLHDMDADGRRIYDEAGWDPADLVQLCVERLREPAARDPEASRHLMHMLHRVREVAEQRGELAVTSEVGRQVEMLLALVDANGMLPRDRQRLEREADAIVDGA
jgi:uncharacterized membrane protein